MSAVVLAGPCCIGRPRVFAFPVALAAEAPEKTRAPGPSSSAVGREVDGIQAMEQNKGKASKWATMAKEGRTRSAPRVVRGAPRQGGRVRSLAMACEPLRRQPCGVTLLEPSCGHTIARNLVLAPLVHSSSPVRGHSRAARATPRCRPHPAQVQRVCQPSPIKCSRLRPDRA